MTLRVYRGRVATSCAEDCVGRVGKAFLVGFSLLFSGCTVPAARFEPANLDAPKPAREMRGAWIATVSNIDWPSTNGLTTAQQKAELIALLETAKQLNLNTVIFQVRPGCDALYASSLEPWSEYLTGRMGKPPDPFYDPLSFAVQEAHKRGLELHAWFNPYRARHASATSPVAASHVSRTKPQLVRQYGKSLWLDPGEKEVQNYSLAVILDVVARYDVDGVHIDDYFYPYKEKSASGAELDFPDEASWKRFGSGKGLNRDGWRRENVNTFVRRTHEEITKRKRWVKFGVSPFGIWRPGNPPQVQGFDAYDKLYADSRAWLVHGWADYFAPQLYWAIDAPQQRFPILLDWWRAQNPHGLLIAPGLDTTKTARRWPKEEIINQIRITRSADAPAGHIHWNMGALMRNPALVAALRHELYAQPALVPVPSRLVAPGPERPILTTRVTRRSTTVNWKNSSGTTNPSHWVVQSRTGSEWNTKVFPGTQTFCRLGPPMADAILVTGVDRGGNLGPPSGLQRKD